MPRTSAIAAICVSTSSFISPLSSTSRTVGSLVRVTSVKKNRTTAAVYSCSSSDGPTLALNLSMHISGDVDVSE